MVIHLLVDKNGQIMFLSHNEIILI